MKKFYLQTFGCQMNAADSDRMAEHLERRGMSPAAALEEADLVIVNTCSVRDHAEHRALSFLGRLEERKKKKQDLKIIVAGCVAERMGKDLERRFPVVDLVVGAKSVPGFPALFDGAFFGGAERAECADPLPEDGRRSPVPAFVTIMRGCENFCSYCIVPYVRGPETSRKADDIVREAGYLAARGAKDVTLLGQNVNSYRDGNTDFACLLERLDAVEGLARIRFMTSHPKDLSDKLIDAMARLGKVCEHLHLPLQSGSDRILNAMNRSYGANGYLKLVETLRKKLPGLSLTTDILVGFPGETEGDFRDTLEAIRRCSFDTLFAFKYSPRPGTAAAHLADDVPREEKERRLAAVLELSGHIARQKNAALVGTVQEVLFETADGGRTRANRKVFAAAREEDIGRLLPVLIADARANSLSGSLPGAAR